MKYAVYVEGKAELLFVADILAKYSNYDSTSVGFACINLNADHWEYVQYPAQGSATVSSSFYQIVNVNNDGRVISKLRKDIPNLIKQGFEIILGLRDVFGKDYGKHENDYQSFLSTVSVEDYEKLRNSGKCSSFKSFMESLSLL